jgi:3-deoxy-D-manno-octulosonic-acid transferase
VITFFYNTVLFFLLLAALPKILWQWYTLGKYRHSFRQRLGWNLPDISAHRGAPVIWMHTISVGETRAIVPLFKKMREHFPEALFLISSVTETGHMEAKRSLQGAHAYFFLPLDFSWIIRRAIVKYRPDLLILCESDFWYHLLHETKKRGARIVLVNGKISVRSARRFSLCKPFARRLFAPFDLLCLQNERFKDSFSALGVEPSKLYVTGNLKLDTTFPRLTSAERDSWKRDLGITPDDRVLVIGSSHVSEEGWLLSALDEVWGKIPTLKVLLVPRHPERFAEVAKLLAERGLKAISLSQKAQKRGDERVVLIDAMGQLYTCYQLAELAIVGGSFVDWVGGHNIFEPVQCRVPVLFGPHMHGQVDLTEVVLKGGAGRQVTLQELPQVLVELFEEPTKRLEMVQAALRLSTEVSGSTQRTWDAILELLKNNPF